MADTIPSGNPKKSVRAIAKEGALSHQELRTLQKEGVDVANPVTREGREQNKAALERGRVKKIELENKLLQTKIDRENGELIPVNQVREDVIAAVSALTAELYALANDVPGQLAGLTETQIRDKMLARIDLLVDKVKEKWAELGENRTKQDNEKAV